MHKIHTDRPPNFNKTEVLVHFPCEMIRMLQLSLILARIAHKGRTAGANTFTSSHAAFAFVSQYSHQMQQTRQKTTHIAMSAASNNNMNGDLSDDSIPPPKTKAVMGKRKIHKSRLAVIYDEMFADDDDSSDDIPKVQDDINFEKNTPIDLNLDSDYPQDLGYVKTSSPVSFPQKERVPPKAANPSTTTKPTFAPVNPTPTFAPANPKPPIARMFMGREMPPSVSEYDNSHYDEEFGAAKPGEFQIPEFHDGMLEELENPGRSSISNTIPKPNNDIGGQPYDEPEPSSTQNKSLDEQDANINTIAKLSAPQRVKIEPPLPPARTNVLPRDLSPPKNWTPPTNLPPRPVVRASISEKSSAILRSSTNGSGELAQEEMISEKLLQIQSELYRLNNGEEFNIKSPKQVSMVLFGVENESTNKVALEALAGNISNTGGNAPLASLILKHRKYTRELKRGENKKENKENGIHVASVSSMRNGNDASSATVNPSTLVSPIANAKDGEREPLLLIDASAYIFRAYYSMPPMHRHDGEPTGATLGFCNMLNKLVLTPMLNGEQPRVALIFDSKDGTNFRKKLFPEYKSNRKACPEDLIPQFDFVKDAATAYGILQLEAPGFEADDVIATLSTMAMEEGCHVNILSGDKDLMQLVTKDDGGACIEMIDPMKMVRFSHDAVTEKWGVEPEKLGDVLALAGDSADNIPGVSGIGPKIAASLIQEYGSLESLFENLDNIKQNARREKLKSSHDIAILSRELVELERNVPLDLMSFPKHFDGVSDFRMESFNQERLLAFYTGMGFTELKKRVQSRLPNLGTRSPPPPTDRYSSILDDVSPSSQSKKSQGNKTQGGNGFVARSNFKAPPKPDDYSDVPF